MKRREFVTLPALAALAAPQAKTAISLNEDNSHFFFSRGSQRIDAAMVDALVDQYAGTQVRELLFSPNSMRTSYASKVWDPVWHGYQPDGPDDQPLFASLGTAEARKSARRWVHSAWQLHRDGIDVYERWIARARKHGMSPWLSMRMNDVHNVDDERAYLHSTFWREHPELRRSMYRAPGWNERALDYGHAAVREYHMKLVRELIDRYDIDGLELDWMRFGYHFRPGHEREGATLLTTFLRETRQLLDRAEQRRGHRIKLGARVPSRPQTALAMGYDAAEWAKAKLIQMLVITPFWATIEMDMPVELWRQLIGPDVLLAGGLELLLRPFPESTLRPTNSIETARAAAATLLDRGVDRVYLFNYMDADTAMADLTQYPKLLREAGELATLQAKPRRHVVTYADTWAPGEAMARPLPAEMKPGQWLAFRLPLGPRPERATEVRLVIDGVDDARGFEVRLNGELARFDGARKLPQPAPPTDALAFVAMASSPRRGDNVIEIRPDRAGKCTWVEIAVA